MNQALNRSVWCGKQVQYSLHLLDSTLSIRNGNIMFCASDFVSILLVFSGKKRRKTTCLKRKKVEKQGEFAAVKQYVTPRRPPFSVCFASLA